MLQVKPLVKSAHIARTVPEPLPDPRASQPFLWLISAKVASGKSVLISNLLMRTWAYKQYFDRVYFCSANVGENKEIFDIAYKSMHLNKDRIYDDFTENIFDEIVQDIRSDEDFDESQYLLVIDDLPTQLTKRTSRIIKQLLRHRHIHLSVIIVTQKVNLLSTSIRSNASHVCVFRNANQTERASLATMTDMNEDDFLAYLDHATAEPYNFLFVDLAKNPMQLYKNFDARLY